VLELVLRQVAAGPVTEQLVASPLVT